MARFLSLFSGSSGNCTYFGNADEGFLIDAGVSAKKITEALKNAKISPSSLRGIFITHEHDDHVRGLRVFTKTNPLPIYASPKTMRRLLEKGILTGTEEFYEIKEEEISLSAFTVRAFHTSHDAAESVGYHMQFPDGRTAAVATDTGIVTEEIFEGVKGADLVLLEANYDEDMLKNGPYPLYLKKRIQSEIGHLSNPDSASTAERLLKSGTNRLILGHLSRENNAPDKAYTAVSQKLNQMGAVEGVDYLLSVASPVGSSEITVF